MQQNRKSSTKSSNLEYQTVLSMLFLIKYAYYVN